MINVRLSRFSPVYAFGLRQLLCAHSGLRVLEPDAPLETTSSIANVFLVGYAGTTVDSEFISGLTTTNSVLGLIKSDTPGTVDRCFAAGAIGCVHCSVPLQTILDAVESVAIGRRFFAMVDSNSNFAENLSVSLSQREHEVLTYIAEGRTHGQIGRALGISPHTVDTYVKRIRKKLRLGNKAELTRAAMLCGTNR